MDGIPAVTVGVDETGDVVGVDVEGHEAPEELVETRRSGPVAHFGDEEYRQPWRHVA